MTPATWITASRLLAVPVLLYGLQTLDPMAHWICLGVFLLAALTDWLDGYVARRFDQVTELGKFLDPLVDKLLILCPLIALVGLQQIPAWTVAVLLTRELAIAGWRVQQTQISGANLWGKAKTVVQIVAVSLLIAPLPPSWDLPTQLSYGLAIALTLISGLIYLWPQPSAV
ncbi:MAG: CDP-diacylglycerol--glycerol-3-phosphate 3-phosphatidyltransferase [Cyanobacteria bacterium P01_A01_bin.17]